MIKRTATTTLALALLAACQAKDEPIAIDNGSNDSAATMETLPASESGETAHDTTAATAQIPAQYQGRWGMVPADCEPGRSDAKGLLTIDPTTMRFYEARATFKEQRPAIATGFSALFAYSGEGMTWEKVETLTVTGDTLTREDKDGAFTYQRCA